MQWAMLKRYWIGSSAFSSTSLKLRLPLNSLLVPRQHSRETMRASTLCFATAAAVTMVATTPAFARPMHAGIEFQRYLEEIDTTQADLDEWRVQYGDVAQQNGWMPVSEDRSADDQEEDLRQRIFLTKQNIASVQAANPGANFSIMSPFSALTDAEFNTYVLNSYVRGNSTQSASGTGSRQLRSAASSDSIIDDGSSDSTSFIFLKTSEHRSFAVIERERSRQRRQETRAIRSDEQLRAERQRARVLQEHVRTNHTEAEDEEERVRNRLSQIEARTNRTDMKRRKTVHAIVCASNRSEQSEVKRNSQQNVSAIVFAVSR
ncbi:hypothetical protein PHYPSEUDO_010240 [Phytophthora pseudosyringae]|uniref:Uncharacterized protein n=1 Tax=Phytophthora pseudosyringae TaxID=221518 RepID=A0A8T1VAM9_9STRA|nr:hypothetical protein PHYPSEUDO_010240 [Phytophthora pseudosyringae]